MMPEQPDSTGDTDSVSEAQADGGQQTAETSSQQNEFQQQTQAVQYGESVTDIFSRPDTKPLLMQTIAVFAALGIGFGLFGYFAVDNFIGAGEEGADMAAMMGELGALIAAFVIIFVASLVGPVVSVTTSIRVNGMLSYLKDDLSYATGAVGAAIGQIILLVITIFLVTQPFPGEAEIGMGDFTSLILLSVVVTGVVAAASMYALRGLSDPVRPDA